MGETMAKPAAPTRARLPRLRQGLVDDMIDHFRRTRDPDVTRCVDEVRATFEERTMLTAFLTWAQANSKPMGYATIRPTFDEWDAAGRPEATSEERGGRDAWGRP